MPRQKTQIQIAQEFIDGSTEGRCGGGGNLVIKGNQLIHYQTVIAERFGEKIILNYTRYSMVTGKIQKFLKESIDEKRLIIIGKVPINYANSLEKLLHE